jgi:hypothetical protein
MSYLYKYLCTSCLNAIPVAIEYHLYISAPFCIKKLNRNIRVLMFYEHHIFNKLIFLIRILGGGGMETKLGPLGRSVTSGLLYLPRVIVRMENLVEYCCRLTHSPDVTV